MVLEKGWGWGFEISLMIIKISCNIFLINITSILLLFLGDLFYCLLFCYNDQHFY